jgi:hypothetical protein
MTIPTYVKGYPQDGSSLGSTKAQIRKNLDGTFQTLGVDHINNNGQPGSGTPGYHRVIHFQDLGALPTNPSNVVNVTQMYTNTDTHSIQQIILKSTGNKKYQQTTMLDAFNSRFGDDLSSNVAGWTYLPGGLIMNYGFTDTSETSSITVDFPGLSLPNFSNVNYITTVTPYGFASRFSITTGAKFVSGFTITNTTSFPGTGYYWTAIGAPS